MGPPPGGGTPPQGAMFPRGFGTGRARPGDACLKTALDSQFSCWRDCNFEGVCIKITPGLELIGRNDCILHFLNGLPLPKWYKNHRKTYGFV